MLGGKLHFRLSRLVVLMGLLLFSCSVALADSGKSIELPQLLDDLLKNHERLQAAEAAVEAARHTVDRARSGWYPRVDASAEGGTEEIDLPGRDHATSKLRNEETLTATQLLYDFGGVAGSVDASEAMVDETIARREQIRQQLLVQGISAYLMVVRGREMLRYAKLSEENIKRLSGMQEALVNRGAGLSYEDLQVKAQLAGAQAHRVNVERELQTGMNAFRSVFGFSPSEEEVEHLVMPKLPQKALPMSLDAAIESAFKDNPVLVEMAGTVDRNQGLVRNAESSYYPQFDFVVEGVRKEQDQGDDGVRYENRTSVMMNYNLFNGGGDTDAVRAARSDLVSARKSVLDGRRGVEEAVRNAWNDLMTLRKNVELYENQANITWEFLGLVKKKKAMGAEVGLLDILVGERDYISAISSKVTAEIDEVIAAYTLLFQMGRISVEDVRR